MDDGALAGINSFNRYFEFMQWNNKLDPSKQHFSLGGVVHKSIGQASIRISFDDTVNFQEYMTDVINCHISILFGLYKMKELLWYVNELTS